MSHNQTLDAADAIAVFDFGAKQVRAGGQRYAAWRGYRPADQAVSRMATPLDFATLNRRCR